MSDPAVTRRVYVRLSALAAAAALSPAQSRADRTRDLWLFLKHSLEAPNGADFFETNVKDAVIPGGANGLHALEGFVLSVKSEGQSTSVVLAMSDRSTPEVTLIVTKETVSVRAGDAVEFEAVAKSFTPKPFMLTMEVEPPALFLRKRSTK